MIVLVAFSIAIGFANIKRIDAELDKALLQRAIDSSHMGHPGNRRPQNYRPLAQGEQVPLQAPPQDRGQGSPPDPGSDPPSSPSGDPPGGSRPPNPPLPPEFEDQGEIASLRRPHFYDLNGKATWPTRNTELPFDRTALTRALKSSPVFSDSNYRGEQLRVVSLLYPPNGRRDGVVQVARPSIDANLLWNAQVTTLLIFLPVAIVGGAIGALFLTNRALRPIAMITRTASDISSSDLSQRLEVVGEDEMSQLGQTLNQMLARLEMAFAEQQTSYQKLEATFEAQRRFTGDASHELKTPLTRMLLASSNALSHVENREEIVRALQIAHEAGVQMNELVSQLMTLAKADSGHLAVSPKPVDLRMVAADTLERIPGLDEGRVTLDLSHGETIVMTDGEDMARVLINLIQNALRHTPRDGTIKVTVRPDGDRAVLEVSDTGEGIPAEDLPKVFDRFYRVDSARARSDGGAGLGLSIVKTLVEAYQGQILIDSKLGLGTQFSIVFPLVHRKDLDQTFSS